MNGLLKKSLRLRLVGTMLLLGMAALAGTGTVALGQEALQGTFILPVEARLGDTMLPAGEYKFYVEALGSTQATSSMQFGSSPVMVVVCGLAKGGPIVKVLATASKLDVHDPKTPSLQADDAGMVFHSMYLENAGVEVEFYTNKAKHAMQAKGPEVAQRVASAKASD
jgi:hypothetical protein